MLKQNLNSKNIFFLKSKYWFWPLFTGGFFCLGYTITRVFITSKLFTEQSEKPTFVHFQKKKEFEEIKNNFSKGSHKENNIQNKTIYIDDKELEKKIDFPSNNSFLRLKIKYSDKQNAQNQAIFRNSYSFFKKESLRSLLKTLITTKKTKSPKIKTD